MQANRTATGPLKFGDDWPGVFIRGDEALGYAGTLRRLLAAAESRFTELAQDTTELAQDEISAWMRVREFAALLESCRAPSRRRVQQQQQGRAGNRSSWRRRASASDNRPGCEAPWPGLLRTTRKLKKGSTWDAQLPK